MKKLGRPPCPLLAIRRFMADARREIAAANGHLPPVGNHRLLYPGRIADARALGVTANHLYLILSGRRTSHSLLRRYHALKRKAA
jgi:hypothetical protein